MKGLEFPVNEIPEGDLDIRELRVSPSEFALEGEDFKIVAPIDSYIQFLRHSQSIYTKAKFSTSLVVECRRCIESLETEVVADIELQFCQVDDPEKMDPRLIDAGERHYSGEVIDLSEDARQGLILEIPAWPLCSESCKGFCASCGINLNIDECNCHEPAESSSPFSALSELRSEKMDSGRPS
jgi:uncharacterized protein